MNECFTVLLTVKWIFFGFSGIWDTCKYYCIYFFSLFVYFRMCLPSTRRSSRSSTWTPTTDSGMSTRRSRSVPISIPDPDSIRSVDPDPYSESGSKSGSKRAKMTPKSRKIKKFNVSKCLMFSFNAEGFSCSLDVLYRGLRISKLQFLISKIAFQL